jgi:general stress protein YciG
VDVGGSDGGGDRVRVGSLSEGLERDRRVAANDRVAVGGDRGEHDVGHGARALGGVGGHDPVDRVDGGIPDAGARVALGELSLLPEGIGVGEEAEGVGHHGPDARVGCAQVGTQHRSRLWSLASAQGEGCPGGCRGLAVKQGGQGRVRGSGELGSGCEAAGVVRGGAGAERGGCYERESGEGVRNLHLIQTNFRGWVYVMCMAGGPSPALSARTSARTPQTEGNTPNMATPKRKPGGGMTVREAGQKGGETVKRKYGPEFYETIGRKGGEATKLAHGHEFYEQIGKKGGKKGGEATRDRYGPAFYEEIGQKGGQKVKQLIEEGKKAAAAAAAALEASEKKAS